ncbi:phospholipase/carboxylesterase [Aquiflexum balticum DSM 16537]|uniref:Phospholipase/carboxylesterase n=1 Tax=Aquiflexum balticum DSM 16537 TaxID=758820 RepID=A0A1W2H371_9BACT|nr:dienelactone hydrolase family protein [Aquiflexum balticum]SMD43078.1 phospholipase/carboxylesterase [Aquiflexum balticum DSM 16537]
MKTAGIALDKAKKVAIMIHGRGASADSILTLRDHLHIGEFALLAPQAQGNTWYPYSFMAPDASNEPALSNAIKMLDGIVEDLKSKGFKSEQIFFIGFSQGACLSLEYATQNAQKYGGVIAFTGGLIGEKLNKGKYKGDFEGTKVFIGSSHKDMHVPLSRIEESAELIKQMGGELKTLVFKDQNHTIRQEEVDWVNENILK